MPRITMCTSTLNIHLKLSSLHGGNEIKKPRVTHRRLYSILSTQEIIKHIHAGHSLKYDWATTFFWGGGENLLEAVVQHLTRACNNVPTLLKH